MEPIGVTTGIWLVPQIRLPLDGKIVLVMMEPKYPAGEGFAPQIFMGKQSLYSEDDSVDWLILTSDNDLQRESYGEESAGIYAHRLLHLI